MTEPTDAGYDSPVIMPSGDRAMIVEFGSTISEQVNDRVYALADSITKAAPVWLTELVPTYRSLLVQYDSFEHDYADVASELRELVAGTDSTSNADSTSLSRLVFELPVAYGGEHGPDLEAVAEHAKLSTDEVIAIHSGEAYRVYMIGFSPGFPYLGGMSGRIACPRLSTPRTRVPAGSVGIAESQTGVYPAASPGGWQLIGRTPVKLFDVEQDPPSVLQPGHFVRFVPVGPEEFQQIEQQVADGEYQLSSTELS